MREQNDAELLSAYLNQQSEDAFGLLVERHIVLVYSAAIRQVQNPQLAEEITQATFAILAQKAPGLTSRTTLAGWLCRTAHFVARNASKIELRRHYREQEAYMQSLINEPSPETWPQFAPLLDEAVAHLNETDRSAVILRFFERKSLNEVSDILGVAPDAAQKRVSRALEKLRNFFARRGVNSTTSAIAESISAHSLQAVPVGLTKTVTLIAIAKGATASVSTLTLIKGALKIMAWTKTQTAIVAGVVLLLAAGSATVTITKVHKYRMDSWERPPFPQTSDEKLWNAPPQVRIVPSKYHEFTYGFGEPGLSYSLAPGGTTVQTNESTWQSMGIGEILEDVVRTAYNAQPWQVIYETQLPKKPLYDFISNQHNLPHGTAQPLQELIRKQFGISATWEPRKTDVVVIQLANPGLQAFKPPGTLMRSVGLTKLGPLEYALGTQKYQQDPNGSIVTETDINVSFDQFLERTSLAYNYNLPVVNETGLTNRYDCAFAAPRWNPTWEGHPEVKQAAWHDAFLKQLGLELILTNRETPMLVVQKAN